MQPDSNGRYPAFPPADPGFCGGGGGRCAAVVFTFVSHGYYMTGCNTEVKGFTWRA